jgi:hypothetical protein
VEVIFSSLQRRPRVSAYALALVFLLASQPAISEVLTLPQVSHKRCVENKEPGACYEIGDLYQQTSKPGDVAMGDQYVRYGCKLEMKKSCSLAEANVRRASYLKSKKAWDSEKQKALNEMPSVKTKDELECEKGVAKACGLAGTHYFYLRQTLNPAKGKALFEEGCRLGDSASCDSVNLIKKGLVRVYDVEM